MYCSRPGGNKLEDISSTQCKACEVINLHLPRGTVSLVPVMHEKVSRSWRNEHANEGNRQADLKVGNFAK